MWDVETSTVLATYSGHMEAVFSVAFSPDGKRLASGARDRSIRLWNLIGLSFFGPDRQADPRSRRIVQSSFHLIPYRLQELKLEPTDRPRPPGKDPLEWILENVD